MLIDTIKAIMGEVIDFLVTHNEPIFGLSFLSAAVGLGVIEAVSDFFTNGGDSE